MERHDNLRYYCIYTSIYSQVGWCNLHYPRRFATMTKMTAIPDAFPSD